MASGCPLRRVAATAFQVARHALEEVRGTELASLAEHHVEKLRRAHGCCLYLQVIPLAAGANRVPQVSELAGDGPFVAAAPFAPPASGDQGRLRFSLGRQPF